MAPSNKESVQVLSARFIESFAYKTIKDRLPVIVTKVIDGLSRKASQIEYQFGPLSREETKQIIGEDEDNYIVSYLVGFTLFFSLFLLQMTVSTFFVHKIEKVCYAFKIRRGYRTIWPFMIRKKKKETNVE